MSAVIGIDIGSSAIKAVLYEPETGSVLCGLRTPIRSRIAGTPPGHHEEDPVAIQRSAFQLIREIGVEASKRTLHVRAIAFTGQMHGGLLVDRNLAPLTNFITWQDKRGDEIGPDGKTFVDALQEYLPDDATGVGIHTGFLLASIKWIASNGGVPADTASIIGIYDWLTGLLVGRAVTDITSAAAWGMFDPVNRRWNTEAISSAGMNAEWLPEVVEPGSDVGTIDSKDAEELGLPTDVRIHASIGDTQATYLGSRCTADEILLNFGTGSQSMWESDQPMATDGTDIRYLSNGRWLATVPTLAGGESFRILAEFFRNIMDEIGGVSVTMDQVYEAMDRFAEHSAAEGLTFDPIFAGSKFGSRDAARASIAGITASNFRPGPLARALVEGMIEEIAAPYFARFGKVRHSGLAGAGTGLRRSAALREAAEARFGLGLRLVACEEEAALGAALLCGDR